MGDVTDKKPQLEMVWPESRLDEALTPRLAQGYALHVSDGGEPERHVRLMRAAGFENWSEERLQAALRLCLPGGFFLIKTADGDVVATAMATHNPSDRHPFGGEIGWVASHPHHRGKGLGLAVSVAATRRFLDAGYRRIYLRTDDFRLPAVKTYLRLGYVPLLFEAGMEDRWRAVCRQIGARFDETGAINL